MNCSVRACVLAAIEIPFLASVLAVVVLAVVIGGSIHLASEVFPRLAGKRWFNPVAAAGGIGALAVLEWLIRTR